MAEKMTRKQMFAIIAEDYAVTNPEIAEMAQKYVAQLSKPRKSVHKVKPETIAAREAVFAAVREMEGEFLNKEVAEATELSAQTVAAALRFLESEGHVTSEKVGSKPKVYTFVG